MVASTDIKFYVHTNTNAPQLTNDYGCMIAVLDACLVTGFGSQAVSSIAAPDTTATVTFNSAHNFMQYQVIEIAGADQAEYNGQHRILTVPNANSITFDLAAAPSAATATGNIICKLPSLGWSLPFSASGKRAYKNTDPGSPYLRVVDAVDPAYSETYAKYAKVGIVEDMTDIDTMLGHQAPYDSASPDKNWIGTGSGTSAYNGWAKWFYATGAIETGGVNKTTSPTDGVRGWVIVGNDTTFYIFNKSYHANNLNYVPRGFGKLNNLSKIGANPYFLQALDDYTAASASATLYLSALSSTATNHPAIMLRNYKNEAKYVTVSSGVLAGSDQRTGATATFAAPDTNIAVFSSEYIFIDSKVPRGIVPILRWLYQIQPYSHLQTVTDNGRMSVACSCVSSNSVGQILIDLGVL